MVIDQADSLCLGGIRGLSAYSTAIRNAKSLEVAINPYLPWLLGSRVILLSTFDDVEEYGRRCCEKTEE